MRLFDSTVLIAHLRGAEAATSLLTEAVGAGEACCSVLSRTEIEGGMRSDERTSVRRLFMGLDLKVVDDGIASRAGELLRTYRKSHQGIDIVDYLIAATALNHNADLLTLNVKHFPMFEGLAPAF